MEFFIKVGIGAAVGILLTLLSRKVYKYFHDKFFRNLTEIIEEVVEISKKEQVAISGKVVEDNIKFYDEHDILISFELMMFFLFNFSKLPMDKIIGDMFEALKKLKEDELQSTTAVVLRSMNFEQKTGETKFVFQKFNMPDTSSEEF